MKKSLFSIIGSLFLTFYLLAPHIEAACFTSGVPTVGEKCCSGYVAEPRSGACIPTTVNPYKVTQSGSNKSVCEQIGNPANCSSCMDGGGVWTAIGCLDVSSGGFAKTLFGIGIGVGSMIAFILILFGALQMMTSAGNPEKLHAGKELVTAAITGLLFILFSVFLLRIIGVNIIGIPGFS